MPKSGTTYRNESYISQLCLLYIAIIIELPLPETEMKFHNLCFINNLCLFIHAINCC